jgi:hypothetical protein
MPDHGPQAGRQAVEGIWVIEHGRAFEAPDADPFATGPDPATVGDLFGVAQGSEPPAVLPAERDTVRLHYNNPFRQDLERVWFEGKIVYAVELGELDVDVSTVKVAQEYQVVYSAELDENGKPVREPERVPGQYNIYDSVPGMEKYSPLWQFNYVIVPRDYKANTLRSEQDCLESGYPILQSTVIEN